MQNKNTNLKINNSNNELIINPKDIKITEQNNKKTNNNNFDNKGFFKKLQLKPYELLFLICDVCVVVSIFIFFERNILSFICSFIGCFAIFSLAKGFFFAPIINVAFDILYIILSYTQCFYGEALIYILMTLPIDFYSSFTWIKNKSNNSEVIKINKIKKIEWLFFWLGTVVLTVVFYFILKALHTSELIISTISFITSAMAGYFLIRRSNYYSLAYSFNDLILIALWTTSFIKFGTSYLPVVINFCCSFVIDFYGFINLQKELKKQTSNNDDSIEITTISNGHIFDDFGIDYVEFANKDDIVTDVKILNDNLKNENSKNNVSIANKNLNNSKENDTKIVNKNLKGKK